jgi:threonine/homoserine/homoserine lactone efflux protein
MIDLSTVALVLLPSLALSTVPGLAVLSMMPWSVDDGRRNGVLSAWRVVVQVLDPTVALFALALRPRLIDPSRGCVRDAHEHRVTP